MENISLEIRFVHLLICTKLTFAGTASLLFVAFFKVLLFNGVTCACSKYKMMLLDALRCYVSTTFMTDGLITNNSFPILLPNHWIRNKDL